MTSDKIEGENLGNDLAEVIWCRMDALCNPAMVQQLNERMLSEFPGADEGRGEPGALEHGEERVLIELRSSKGQQDDTKGPSKQLRSISYFLFHQ